MAASRDKVSSEIRPLGRSESALIEQLVDAIAAVVEVPYCECGKPRGAHVYWQDRVYDVNGYRCPESVTGTDYRYSDTQTKRHLRNRQVAAVRAILDPPGSVGRDTRRDHKDKP